jgi:hypothetical protein
MRWRRTFLAEVNEKLTQLGLTSCAVCRSGQLKVHRFPFFALMGGLPPAFSSRPYDDTEVTTDVLFDLSAGRVVT